MALNFPGSPTNGQQYQGFVYNSTVGAWQSNPASVAPFYTADTPPTNPTKGDSWFNTNDGTMYIYTYDGNTYQWVEHRSQIAKSQVGLVPIVPTSITLGSGTGSIDVGGNVTFNNSTYVSLTGLFTSSYRNYRLVFECVKNGASANNFINMRFNTGGTYTSTAGYSCGVVGFATNTGSLQNIGGNPSGDLFLTRVYGSGGRNSATVDIFNPQLALYTTMSGTWMGTTSGDGQHGVTSGVWNATNQFDGIYVYPTGENFTGTMKIYGYN